MTFIYPVFLYGLFALPLLALGLFVQTRRSLPSIQRLSLQKGEVIKERYFHAGLFGLLALAALLVAAAGPSLTVMYEEERSGGMDIVFAFDVSRSMNVRDVMYHGEPVARLEGATLIAEGTLTALQARHTEYRYAAAVGKGEGVLAIPLTYGVETVRTLIASLSSSAISAPGTDVEKLTRAAIRAFPPALSAHYPADKRIVVFTDGEALAGQFQDAVEAARNEQITVSAVCIGSETGGPIPIGVTEEGTTVFLQDKSGKNIVSRAESGALREAVEHGGGFFIGGEDLDVAVSLLSGALSPREGDEAGKETRKVARKKDLNGIFAALALVFFALHKSAFYTVALNMGRRQRQRQKEERKRRKALTSALLSVLPFLCLFPSCAPVEAKFRLLEGNFLIMRDMLSEAEASYIRARSLAAPGDIPYALYAQALTVLLREEHEAAATNEETGSAAVALFEEAHALIVTGIGEFADGDKTALAYRHGHGEQHRELAYRIHYNAGIAQYHAGNAEEAAREFRQALLVDPGRIEAKRNLEISLTLLESKSGVATSEVKSARPVMEGASRGNSVLFDFIRQKETGRWKSWAWQGEEGDSSLDY